MDPDRVNGVIDIQKYMTAGSLQNLKQPQSLRVDDRTVLLPGLIVGSRLANQLGVFPGSPLQVVSPLGSPTAIGVIPKVRRFIVVGIFKTDMSEIDSTLVFMNLTDAQKFFELEDAATNIEIRVKDVYQARQIAALSGVEGQV